MTTQHTPGPWYPHPTAGHETHGQSAIASEVSGKTVAIAYDGGADARLLASAPELLEELCNAREWLDELCGLIQSGMFDAASDWVGANAVSTDSTLAATIEKAIGEPVMAA